MSTSQTLSNRNGMASFLSGNSHVLYGAIGLTALGVYLSLAFSSNRTLLLVGLLVALVGVGIAVDVWAHGFKH